MNQGTGIIVLNKHNQVLLGMRIHAREGDTPQWELPGGKPEPGETPEQTIIRELKEETGILTSRVHVYTTYEYQGVLCNCFTTKTTQEPRVAEPEVMSEWKWFTQEELQTLDIWECSAIFIRKYFSTGNSH